ncbi:MAG: dockerin type I repeat-containing protein [Phycisphaerae bacterium]|nr:dockerin type I repeat-containing protein [Phycisphaerae bacterium]
MHRTLLLLALMGAMIGETTQAGTLEFTLLTWDDADATPERPSAVGRKPAQSSQPCDWLLFTEDDYAYAAGWNPFGAVSHNFADPAGEGASAFVMAPSLTCSRPLTLSFARAGANAWDVHVVDQAYIGQATPFAQMNQFLVSAGDPATTDPRYAVDGLPNQGVWYASPENDWSLSCVLDFYLATNTDGNGDPVDIDAAFDNCVQSGHLIPVSELTGVGLDGLDLDDPAGFYEGDFKGYLLEEITPRLPAEATALLITQMTKSHPVFTDVDVSITLGSLVGNTTIAYTTDALPSPQDVDGDGNVDLDDFVILADCLAGPDVAPMPACSAADLDGDEDVDLRDFSLWQSRYTVG